MRERSLVSVVDDDESVRESLPDLLRQFGFAVHAFSSAEAFLASEFVSQTHGPLLMKHLVNKGDGNRSFADSGRHALDVAATHVAHCEDSGTIRFQQIR